MRKRLAVLSAPWHVVCCSCRASDLWAGYERCRGSRADQAHEALSGHAGGPGHRPEGDGGKLLLPARPLRLRQDVHAPDDRGPRGGDRRRHHPRRPADRRLAAGRAHDGDDVPELRALPASELPRQRRLLLEDEGRGQGRTARARPRRARARPHGGLRRAAAGSPLGRPAAAGGAGPSTGDRAVDPPARRAAVGARPVPQGADARGAQAPAAGARHHLHPRHPQPGRGAGAGRSHRRHERRGDRAGGPPPRRLQSAGDALRRPLHRRPQSARRPCRRP